MYKSDKQTKNDNHFLHGVMCKTYKSVVLKEYLPVSISRLCADILNLHKAFLYLQLLIQLRYVSVCNGKLFLKSLYQFSLLDS